MKNSILACKIGQPFSEFTTIHEEVLSRALYATQFTRHIDKSGYVKFKHWIFFGENGLPAGEEVSVWVYENTRDP